MFYADFKVLPHSTAPTGQRRLRILPALTGSRNFADFAVFSDRAAGQRQALGFEFFDNVVIVERIQFIFLGDHFHQFGFDGVKTDGFTGGIFHAAAVFIVLPQPATKLYP